MENKNPIQVADRLFQTIELLSNNGSLGLTEISICLELNKSTAHRILNSLIYMGYVKQEASSAKYSLTFKIWEIANQALGQLDIIDSVRPHLKRLVAQTEETVHLVQLNGTSATYIDKVEAYQNPVRLVSKIGHSIPLYCSGVGKSLLAEMSDNTIETIWKQSNIKAYTPNTITSFVPFMKEIETIRKWGYALDNEENEIGVRCIATALTNYQKKPAYAISISAPTTKMTDTRIQELASEIFQIKKALEKEWI